MAIVTTTKTAWIKTGTAMPVGATSSSDNRKGKVHPHLQQDL